MTCAGRLSPCAYARFRSTAQNSRPHRRDNQCGDQLNRIDAGQRPLSARSITADLAEASAASAPNANIPSLRPRPDRPEGPGRHGCQHHWILLYGGHVCHMSTINL